MDRQTTSYTTSSRDSAPRVMRQGRYNLVFNSESGQWTAQEAQESPYAIEELDVDQNIELLESSARNTSTPIRPYYHSRIRMRRDAAQAYLRGNSIAYYPQAGVLNPEDSGDEAPNIHDFGGLRRQAILRSVDYDHAHIQVQNETYVEHIENEDELSEIRSPQVN